MKCLICGRRTLPGAKLCADCRAARKRAFAATVTQPLLAAAGRPGSEGRLLRPSQSVAATARRAAERALFVKPPPAQEVVPRLRSSDFFLLAAAIAAILIAGAYAAHRLRVTAKPDALAGVGQAAGFDHASTTTGLPVAPTPTALRPAASPQGSAENPAGAPAPNPAAKADAPKRAKPKQNVAQPAPPSPMPEVQTIAAAPAPAPVLEPPEPPRPNPWQSMNDGLARCADNNLLDHIICDQRVRLQYCNGYWGQVPQCPGGVANDHGQ